MTYRGIFDQENEVETILGRYISTEVSKTQILINNGNGIIPFILDYEKLLKPFFTIQIDSKVNLSKISCNIVGLVVCNQD